MTTRAVTAFATTKAATSSGRCEGCVAAASYDVRYATGAEVVQTSGLSLRPLVD